MASAEEFAGYTHRWMFTGGEYIEKPDGVFYENQAYVDVYEPLKTSDKKPVILLHGGSQTGSNFVATADGRAGWAVRFVRAGHPVYILDQVEHGRSGHVVKRFRTKPVGRRSVAFTENMFTNCASAALWPQASLHDQWPGDGVRGDPVFDQFYAAQVENLLDRAEAEQVTADAIVALLDDIGETVLITHSQSGPIGWLVADQRPHLISALIAMEPAGPPFQDVMLTGGHDWWQYDDKIVRKWGIARVAIHSEPDINDLVERDGLQQHAGDEAQVATLLPAGGICRFPNLAKVRMAIFSAQASYHAAFDHCTSRFLDWASVPHDFVSLEEHGIAGNGHMMMMERNSDDIAKLMLQWLN